MNGKRQLLKAAFEMIRKFAAKNQLTLTAIERDRQEKQCRIICTVDDGRKFAIGYEGSSHER